MLAELGLADAPARYVAPMSLDELKIALKAWFTRQKDPLSPDHAIHCQAIMARFGAARASDIAEDKRREFITALKQRAE